MFDKLDSVAARYEEISRRLMEPDVTGDPEQYASLMKEYSRLTPIVEKYRAYRTAKDACDEAREVLDESGVHRVQRVPETETQGRIHTSTVTVAVLPEAEEVEFELDPRDLQIDVFRSSGAGGQHVNKTSSAIRVTHLPTGMVVECQDERSQYKNKDRALKVLRARLLDIKVREQNDKIATERRLQVGTGDRSERIRTYNYPQGRVTDHRIGLTLYKLDSVLNGDLAELFDALMTFDQAEKLKSAEEA